MSESYDEGRCIGDTYIVTYNMINLTLNDLFRDIGIGYGSNAHTLSVKLDHTGLEYTLRLKGEHVKGHDHTH